MKITDYMNTDWICININESDKNKAIIQLFNKILKSNKLSKDSNKILEAIFAREELMSTGVGAGIALPHAKSPICNDFVIAVGVSPDGIEYDAIDDEKVKIICMLIGPEKEPNKHIKFLSLISKVLSREQARKQIISAKNQEEIFQLFCKYENE